MARAPRPSTGTMICPKCASPKTLQAKECWLCWVDRIRIERRVEHGWRCPCEPCRERDRAARRERRRRNGEVKGTSTGRPQPQSHPWRKRDAVLYGRKAA